MTEQVTANIDKAVQADQILPEMVDAAVQAVMNHVPHLANIAVQVDLDNPPQCSHNSPAGQAGFSRHQPRPQPYQPQQIVQDVLCPDLEYYKHGQKESELDRRQSERQADLKNFMKMLHKTSQF